MLSEKAIVKELSKPEAYNHEVKTPIKIVETNVSWVFLTGTYAYKMKKTIKFGDVLDFSTLQKRYIAGQQEIKLNKRLAPDLYIDLVPFTTDKRISGDGDVIEYLVKMREIPQEKLLINIIKETSLKNSVVDQIVDLLVNFHKSNLYKKRFDAFKDIFEKWDENFRTTQGYEQFPFDNSFADKVYSFMEDNREFWVSRLENGKIVDGHGDLQLRNIFIDNGKIIIFDCIEFNESLRIQDILEEISFLAMDLDFHNMKKQSKFLLKKYLHSMGEEYEKVKNFVNFYKAYRAYVRAKVYYSMYLNSLDNIPIEQSHLIKKLSLEYFKLSKSYFF